jgi:hypothetical protein
MSLRVDDRVYPRSLAMSDVAGNKFDVSQALIGDREGVKIL